MQERRNSIADSLKLRHFCTNSSIYLSFWNFEHYMSLHIIIWEKLDQYYSKLTWNRWNRLVLGLSHMSEDVFIFLYLQVVHFTKEVNPTTWDNVLRKIGHRWQNLQINMDLISARCESTGSVTTWYRLGVFCYLENGCIHYMAFVWYVL